MNSSPAYNRDVDAERQRAAMAIIDKRIKAAQEAFKAELDAIEKIADEHDIEVYLEFAGAGQTYAPKLPEGWDSSSCVGYSSYYERGQWLSSSERC